MYGQYDKTEDRESAYEKLARKASIRAAAQSEVIAAKEQRKTSSGYQRQTATERFVKNLASSVGRSVGNALIRGILGGLTRR